MDWCRERPTIVLSEGSVEIHIDRTLHVTVPRARYHPTALGPDPASVAYAAIEAAVGFDHVYEGGHQGFIGHVVTHAHALLTMRQLGYDQLYEEGLIGLAAHIAAAQCLWSQTVDRPEVTESIADDPRSTAYWSRDFTKNNWAGGHTFKYPYALLGMLPLLDDRDLVRRALLRFGQLI